MKRASRQRDHASLIFRTRWGWTGLAASQRGLCAIVLPMTSRRSVQRALKAIPLALSLSGGEEKARRALLQDAKKQLADFLAGERCKLDLPLDLSNGTVFQRRVWRATLRIPYGRVRSYKWVAALVGGARYARAVGLALGANPVPIAVPCHRVVASARGKGKSNGHPGSLGGFSCGLPAKRRLLALEGTLAQLRKKR